MIKRLTFILLTACLVATANPPAQDPPPAPPALQEDPPLVGPPKPGTLQGQITPAAQLKRLWAVSRATGKRYEPARLDAETGRFVFENLPGDAAYDIGLQTADGRCIEGIDLAFDDARMLRLAEIRRRQLGLPPERAHTFTEDDAAELAAFAQKQQDFMDWGRALYVQGHGRRATVLVELMRTQPFYAGAGQVIWRVELWYFENQFGGWQRVPNTERVLRRERISPAEWKKIHVEYLPQLSVTIDEKGRSEPVSFQIPAKADESTGRPAGSEPKLPARPVVLGAVAAPPPPAEPDAPEGG